MYKRTILSVIFLASCAANTQPKSILTAEIIDGSMAQGGSIAMYERIRKSDNTALRNKYLQAMGDLLTDPLAKDIAQQLQTRATTTGHIPLPIIASLKDTALPIQQWHPVKYQNIIKELAEKANLTRDYLESKTSIMRIQQLLVSLGYNPGTPDGVFGNTTKNAVRMFQNENQLSDNYAISFNLIEELENQAKQDIMKPIVKGVWEGHINSNNKQHKITLTLWNYNKLIKGRVVFSETQEWAMIRGQLIRNRVIFTHVVTSHTINNSRYSGKITADRIIGEIDSGVVQGSFNLTKKTAKTPNIHNLNAIYYVNNQDKIPAGKAEHQPLAETINIDWSNNQTNLKTTLMAVDDRCNKSRWENEYKKPKSGFACQYTTQTSTDVAEYTLNLMFKYPGSAPVPPETIAIDFKYIRNNLHSGTTIESQQITGKAYRYP